MLSVLIVYVLKFRNTRKNFTFVYFYNFFDPNFDCLVVVLGGEISPFTSSESGGTVLG